MSLLLSETDRELGLRPLTARSLLASMLLGTHPPRLPVRALVAAAALFGISEGAARTALSRMMRAGDVVAHDGWYELGPRLAERQRRQDIGRTAERRQWDGSWRQLIATTERRSAATRSATRLGLLQVHYAELREGVWSRPSNLADDPLVTSLISQGWIASTTVFDTAPDVEQLWQLDHWNATAAGLGEAIRGLTEPLEQGDRSQLARGFVLAAAALRLFWSDPLLPDELLPLDWRGASLRHDYDRFDRAYRLVLRGFFREAAPR